MKITPCLAYRSTQLKFEYVLQLQLSSSAISDNMSQGPFLLLCLVLQQRRHYLYLSKGLLESTVTCDKLPEIGQAGAMFEVQPPFYNLHLLSSQDKQLYSTYIYYT